MKNELRIIGGLWRRRKISFPDTPSLRPTPDRVRETLFNWLQQDLERLTCLDLFAGSGALGFEAASRGAAQVVMVERCGEACSVLKKNCALLNAIGVTVVCMDVFRFLASPSNKFDVVFLDPPFRHGLTIPCCGLLEERGWLAPHARIYIETESEANILGLPENWQILREKRTGEVGYHLFQRNPH